MDTDDEKNLRTALQFKELGDLSFQNRNLSDANFYYVNCIKTRPEWKSEIKRNFLVVLSCLGQWLEKNKQYAEIFAVYHEALSLYNDSEEVHHNMGAHLLRLGCPDKASYYFQEALKRNSNYFPAYRSLHTTYCAMIERWHFRMLNDTFRNEGYKEAIRKKVSQGFNTVLDIGTGTGIFCLYALEAGAQKIYACDFKQIMISIASNVFERNNVTNKIKLMQQHSDFLKVPIDIDPRVSLLITEMMDSCMIGEHMLYALKYAWEHLLLPPYTVEKDNKPILNTSNNGAVIPHSGSLWFAAVQSEFLVKNFMYPKACNLNANECATALANISLRDDAVPENFKHLSLANIEIFNGFDDDPYDTERLQCVSDCLFLTESHQLFHVNFNDPQHIEKFLGEKMSYVEITCTQHGYFHAIVAWFKVHLDECIELCSAVDDINARNSCWDQAIFPMNKPYRVVPGCRILLSTEWLHNKVQFRLQRITYPNGSVTDECQLPMPVSPGYSSMLNDSDLLACLKNAAIEYVNKFSKSNSIRIFDLYPIPIFGLHVLCNAHLLNVSTENMHLVYLAKSDFDAGVVKLLAESNGISVTCLEVIMKYDFDDHISYFKKGYFDVIVMDLLHFQGDLNEDMICYVNTLRPLLKENGVFLPNKINLCSQLIHSDYIEKSMRVVNNDIHRYNVADSINEYQVSQMLELNVSTLSFEKYSNTFLCYQFSIEDLNTEFKKQFVINTVRRGTANAVLYWYNICFFNDQNYYSSLQDYSYVHQAAFLTRSPLTLDEHDNVLVELIYHHGAFLVIVKHCDSSV